MVEWSPTGEDHRNACYDGSPDLEQSSHKIFEIIQLGCFKVGNKIPIIQPAGVIELPVSPSSSMRPSHPCVPSSGLFGCLVQKSTILRPCV